MTKEYIERKKKAVNEILANDTISQETKDEISATFTAFLLENKVYHGFNYYNTDGTKHINLDVKRNLAGNIFFY